MHRCAVTGGRDSGVHENAPRHSASGRRRPGGGNHNNRARLSNRECGKNPRACGWGDTGGRDTYSGTREGGTEAS